MGKLVVFHAFDQSCVVRTDFSVIKTHFISLTSLPTLASPSGSAFVIEGYPIEGWRDDGADYRAIADIDPAELANFRWPFDVSAKPGPDKRS